MMKGRWAIRRSIRKVGVRTPALRVFLNSNRSGVTRHERTTVPSTSSPIPQSKFQEGGRMPKLNSEDSEVSDLHERDDTKSRAVAEDGRDALATVLAMQLARRWRADQGDRTPDRSTA